MSNENVKLIELLKAAGADMTALGEYMSDFEGNVAQSLAQISVKIASPISAAISALIGYVLLFVVAFIVFKLLSFIFVKLMELPGLSTANRIGGFIIGLASGYVICWLGCGLTAILVGFFAPEIDLSGAFIFSFFA